jgi:precorrin-6y C5,15-methyltransferase (decarboxylating) CbiE subunit
MVLGHPGKLAKLAARQWDTHSARSTSALPLVAELCREVLAHVAPETPTTEGLFAALDGAERKTLADALARRIRFAVAAQLAVDVPIAVWLVDMAGQAIGADGDFSPWASLPPPTPRERASRDEPAEGDEKVAAANVVPSALTSSPSPGTVQGMVSGPAESLADITIVGCGPGAPDYVTPVARRAVARAEIVVGSPRLLQLFPEAPPARILVGADISAVLDQMAAVAGGRNLVVLVSGDAGLYSLSQNVVSRFGWARCTVIPGISSLQVAFARLGLDWADVRVLSAHGRWPAIAAAELALVPKIAILAGGATGLHYAAQVAAALQTSHAVFLCENLTLEDERVQSMTAEELAQCDAASLAIVLIIRRSLIL